MKSTFSLQPDWIKLPPGFRFRMVNNIAEDSAGRIYFAHRGARPLVRFQADGTYAGAIGEADIPLSVNYDLSKNPPAPIGREYWLHGMHVDPWDNIWTTDLARQLVMKFDPAGRLALTLGTPDRAGTDERTFHQPTAVAVGRSGQIYVADGYGNARVVKFSPAGEYLRSWGRPGIGPGEFNTPHGLALDEDENVYVAERLNHRVQVFDREGKLRSVWPDIPRADAIFVHREGDVLVGSALPGNNAIHRYDRQGRRLATLGVGPNAFGYPHGIHFDRAGDLYVADPVGEHAAKSPAKFIAS